MSWAQGWAGTTICGHKAFFLYVSSWQEADFYTKYISSIAPDLI